VSHEAGKSWGKCPHCHAANPEAVTVLDINGPVKAETPSTAVSANLPPVLLPEISTAKIVCPRCGKLFAGPADRRRTWLSCPHCHEVNTDALLAGAGSARAGWRAALGVLLLLAGFLGATFGTFLCYVGVTLGRVEEGGFLTLLWLAGSLCLLASGIFMLRVGARLSARVAWGSSALLPFILLFGLSVWIAVIGVCSQIGSVK